MGEDDYIYILLNGVMSVFSKMLVMWQLHGGNPTDSLWSLRTRVAMVLCSHCWQRKWSL